MERNYRKLILFLALLFGAVSPAAATSSFTPRLGLENPAGGDFDWSDAWSNNNLILDGTGISSTTVTTLTAGLILDNTSFILIGPEGYIKTSSSVTASAFFGDGSGLTNVTASFFGGFVNQGVRTQLQIQALICPGGKGACVVYSSDEGDPYVSTGTLVGQYRNSRTGKGP